MPEFTYHTFLEAIGLVTIVFGILVPFYGTVWEVSKMRYAKELEAKKAAGK